MSAPAEDSTLKKAENFVKESDGASAGGPATEDRNSKDVASSNQMESDLEMKKDSKTSTDKATDVAGRENKGMGLADKLVPGK